MAVARGEAASPEPMLMLPMARTMSLPNRGKWPGPAPTQVNVTVMGEKRRRAEGGGDGETAKKVAIVAVLLWNRWREGGGEKYDCKG